MSILVNKRSRIVVQGLVESAGLQHTLAGRRYGHGRRCFVAGVGPSPLGGALEGIPVFKTVAEARAATGATTSVVYARPGHAAEAIDEAAEAGMELVVCVSNGVPPQDLSALQARLQRRGTRLLGPGCAGVVTPGEVQVGALPGDVHRRGRIGIVSRSVALTAYVARHLAQFGLGASTVVGLPQAGLHGLTHLELLKMFSEDDGTDAVLLVGSVGEDELRHCAEWIAQHMEKPLVGYIEDGAGAAVQRSALQACGVQLASDPALIGELTASVVDCRWLPFD